MATDGGPRAWAFLRRNPVYRAAWPAAAAGKVSEAAPFPVRIQSQADREALWWGLLAWEDPRRAHGPASPFWAGAPMLEGEWGPEPPPLARLVSNAGARLSALRLADGTLILKIENRSAAAQVRMRPGPAHARTGFDSEVATGLVLRLGFGVGHPFPVDQVMQRREHPLRVLPRLFGYPLLFRVRVCGTQSFLQRFPSVGLYKRRPASLQRVPMATVPRLHRYYQGAKTSCSAWPSAY